ncbi:hemerythrin domain-containing protein [Aidingimonas halophila]|nr:hemerythrin domain-containing protein [Aidingimonas halophila]
MLTQLRLDHANMARLLHVLQLKHKTLAAGERPDFQLVREVVDYILDYMDDFTVPLERICSEQLSARVPQSMDLSRQLAEDYKALHERLMRLSQDIDMILMDAVIPMDRFADDLKAYLEAHRAYLRDERESLFPLIQEYFDDDDLQRLADAMPEGAAEKLEQLQDAYPQLYAELSAAPEPATTTP